jgi:hypothetical protein
MDMFEFDPGSLLKQLEHYATLETGLQLIPILLAVAVAATT